ncbi:hypothetical protein K8942_03785 [Candidatus Peribacteria bacterium]|nr:MAG: hypothetical protein K8942_03785 [Candidatus Peribacteria bacterium]
MDSASTPVPPVSYSTFEEKLAALQHAVGARRPVLNEVLRKHGERALFDYANDYVDVNLNPPIIQRQDECLSVLHEFANERFGMEVADGVVKQLRQYYFVSTADHVGPVTHPFFVNSNLLTALTEHGHQDPSLQYIIDLPCTNISLGNSSFPRGLLFSSATKGALQTHKLAFLPSNAHSSSVHHFRPYMAEEIVKIQKQLREKVQNGDVDKAIGDKIHDLIEEIYNQPSVLACKHYSDQVAKTNFHLWSKFFGASGVKLPKLVYLDQEEVVIRLLTKFHLNQDTVIHHILFDPNYESFVNDYFEGIFGSFSRKDQMGTYLFWALPAGEKLNQQLWRKGNRLVTQDESFSVELQPEAIHDALMRGELIPSLLLNFMTLSFYYGLKCLGGFNQVNYLTLMKNAYIRMNVDFGNYRSIECCARAQTKEICDGLTIAFIRHGDQIALANGLDLCLYDDAESWQRLVELSKSLTLQEAINPLLPEIYKISYNDSELHPQLLELTDMTINEHTGLNKKLSPCVEIPC